MASRQRSSVRILCSRERGSQSLSSQRLLQLVVEEKVRWMKWQSQGVQGLHSLGGQKVELPDSPRSTFLLAFSPDRFLNDVTASASERTLMASTHVNHNIYITEVKTGKCLHSLVATAGPPGGGSESWFTESNVAIASLAFHPTAQLLLIATKTNCTSGTGADQNPSLWLVRFDPLGHNLLTAIVNPSNQQSEEDSEVPMDSVEMPHFRQRSFLPSQPVRRTPILHNFLHILSSAPPRGISPAPWGTPSPTAAWQKLPACLCSPSAPPPTGCTQHLGLMCLCSRCSINRPPPPEAPPPSSFSSARTEPRPERSSAFTSVYYSAGSSLNPPPPPAEPPRNTPDWTRNLLSMREGGGGGVSMLPPRTSSSSISLLSVLRQQDAPPRCTPLPPRGGGASPPGHSGHQQRAPPVLGRFPWKHRLFRNVLQCNLSRYFLEFDRMQELEPNSDQLLNNNLDPERPGPSSAVPPTIIHYQPPLPPPPPPPGAPPPTPRGHLNRCRACHNLLTFNHDSQRWERTSQTSSTSEPPPPPSSPPPLRRPRPPQSPPARHPPASAFPIAPTPGPSAEQTWGWSTTRTRLSGRGCTGSRPPAGRLLESSLLSLSRYDMSGSRDHPIYPDPARDSIRQRSLRYQQNRLRAMSSSDSPNPPSAMDSSDRFLLPEYLPYAGIFHERGQPGLATHSSVNRVLAGASIGDGQSAVASNIANTTYRLQWWDFTKFDLPEISNDGQLLAVFIPSSQRGFPDEGILAIYSLAPHNLGEMLYTRDSVRSENR
ncbi:hypothetical protein F7725_023537 [Dissostichus mawsoni]|uniref:Uncharacterized protein n=1 Tax=Dissostichus mawsoni TaxID=36200 RepID=A0A7J5Z0Z2_DISMA|nr:hypothetical protein F7725_023537 [Dissostichus mawsoni]